LCFGWFWEAAGVAVMTLQQLLLLFFLLRHLIFGFFWTGTAAVRRTLGAPFFGFVFLKVEA